jgi:DNA-binding PadR family transcriptional regulator
MSSATPTSPTLTPAAFQVLLALASGHAHGYAVMGFVEQVTGGAVRLGPGTLYRTIARLVSDGLVVEAADSDPEAPHDARRRYYALTDDGRRAAAAEAELFARLTEAAVAAGLLPEGSIGHDNRRCS